MAYQKALNSRFKIKRYQTVYILYWLLLSYILAALTFWFIALYRQNVQLSHYRKDMIDVGDVSHEEKQNEIEDAQARKTAQYIGEGIVFILFIGAGAIIVFRAINIQFRHSQQQANLLMAITHELKTPIAITKLNLETLQKRALTTDQQQRLISVTIQEANRLNALCNNMLLTSQIDAGEYKITKERINFSKLVNECAQNFITRFPARKIETQLPDEVYINGDLLSLQLAVNNLLDNALKYSGKEDIVLLKIFEDKNNVLLQVIDEGQGISGKESKKIFQKYFRGSLAQAKGTGLGLYLTKKIVQAHKGNIIALNNNERGSIFEIKFNKTVI